MGFKFEPGHILLAEELRGFHLTNFVPSLLRLVTGNKVCHVAIVESCTPDTLTYWDASPKVGVHRYEIPNVWDTRESGILLSNDMVVSSIAVSPIQVTRFDIKADYNYAAIYALAKDHLLRRIGLPGADPDTSYGKKLVCSQYIGWLTLATGGARMSELFPGVRHPAFIEPDNFLADPFKVIPMRELPQF